MNILVFSWRDAKHPMAGGAEQVDHEHHKGWIDAGHTVTLFTSNFFGGKKAEEVDNVKIIRKGSQYLSCHMMAFFWYVFGTHEKYDLVIDEFHGWPFFTPLYVRKPKLAVIQELTREVWFKYPLRYGLNYVLGTLGYLLEPLFFWPYKKVNFMTGSESAKKELETVGISKKSITVIQHGVILNLPQNLPHKEKNKTIIFLGALAKDKGIEDAIRTFGILNKKDKFIFWVVGKGNGNYLSKLKSLGKKLHIEESIKFWGFVSQKQKFELLAKAQIMLNPSIREGWGLVNIEANAVGTPVVSYNSPGLTDSVKDGVSGVIAKENTPNELARIVIEIINDNKRYKNLQRGALDWSNKFSWENSRKLSLALIEKIGLE